ncbi:hypothetical protein GCM10010266_58540 [Streptomyces griseomycini]|nr:hypothetical protein GCM10010266_58540 [Streptomyces griseomycini]
MAGENVTGVESVEQSEPQPAGAVDDRLTDVGLLEIVVSRGRGGSFEPKTVRKRHKRLTGVDEMVIPSAAKGLTTGEVQAHLAEVRGAEVSRRTVCTITDEVLGGMAGWLQPAARRRLSGGLRRRRPREDPRRCGHRPADLCGPGRHHRGPARDPRTVDRRRRRGRRAPAARPRPGPRSAA